jgi:hypothetical protein
MTLDLLRHEFNAEDGSFLAQLRAGYHWLHCYHASTKRPSRVQRSHDDTGEHDHMADTILTESEASLAVEDLGWRYLLDCLTTAVTVGSLSDACEVIRAAVDIAGPHANDHLRLRATARARPRPRRWCMRMPPLDRCLWVFYAAISARVASAVVWSP